MTTADEEEERREHVAVVVTRGADHAAEAAEAVLEVVEAAKALSLSLARAGEGFPPFSLPYGNYGE